MIGEARLSRIDRFAEHTNSTKKVCISVIGPRPHKFTSEVVSRETLVDKGFLSGINKSMPIKILAKGEFNKALTFKGIEKFSAKALELIKKAGGKVENA